MMARAQPWEDSALQARAVEAVVQITREFPVSREEVFAAWTEPELFRQWFTPPGGSSSSAELDVRPGGKYRITMEPRGLPGPAFVVGTYLEVLAPERLVYTFTWELPRREDLRDHEDLRALADLDRRQEELETLDSRVTVQFRDLGESTEVSVTHERLATRDSRAFHIWGWESSLDKLADVLYP
jgi:uncharacterized protein YndB with AHSA1/START domain